MKRLIALLAAAVLSGGLFAATANADTQGKVLVCKYVGTPGEDERIQTGQNPIEVSVNAINEYQDNDHSGTVTPGDAFADAQGRSVVITNESECVQPTETPSPTPTETPTPTPTPTPTDPPACDPAVRFGEWRGDPRIDITLTGDGRYAVKGGLYRVTGKRVARVRLACGETFIVEGYKVHGGERLYVYRNGVLVATRRAPYLH